jgi:3-oxoacyl-[acyl-carrier protein] reductase
MKTPDFRLDGRVAVITGASRGLGKAMAFAMGAAGAKVAINYARSQETAERTFDEYCAAGYKGMLVRANVIDEAEVDGMISQVEATLGNVDIVVINATPDQPLKPIEQYDWAFYQQMLDFFVKSPYLITRRVLPHMKHAHHGRIINITSEVFRQGVSPFSAYVAAKGAQIGWSRSMARELAPWQITVNMVAPGWIPVERHAHDSPEMKEGYRKGIPMGHFGVPSDVGGAVTFLASEAASFITGVEIPVNGGVTVW